MNNSPVLTVDRPALGRKKDKFNCSDKTYKLMHFNIQSLNSKVEELDVYLNANNVVHIGTLANVPN